MITKIKHKIFIGVLLVAILLAGAAGMVLYQFVGLNKSVGSLMDDNYKSIQACQKMTESLEREDSGILLLLMGKREEGRAIISSADSVFIAALAIAEANLTEENEELHVKAIGASYGTFKSLWETPITGTDKEGNIEWYTQKINQAFLETKGSVNALLNLNQSNMYQEASQLKQKTQLAIMPGIVSIVAVIVFAFIFNFFLSQSFLVPLRKLIEATRSFNASQSNFSPKIKANDEFKELENGIQDLIVKLNRFHKES